MSSSVMPDKGAFVQTIIAYLSGAAKSLGDTVHELTHRVADDKDFGDTWGMWAAFNYVAERNPDAQDRLIELLIAIKSLPSVMTADGVVLSCWAGTFWEDMPFLRPNMRESWNFFDPDATNPDRDAIRQHWVNLNAFVARITDAQIVSFDLYAIWACRDALEQPIDESTDPKVRAAAQWIFHAGHRIYQSEQIFEHGPQRGDPARPGALWTGNTSGFCKERWEFWKERFGVLAVHETLSLEARRDAADAVDAMANVEARFMP